MTDMYPEIEPKINSCMIHSQTRKLKAVWSHEAQQDLRSMHNIDVSNELANILAQEITKELDEEILADLRNNTAKAKEEDVRKKNRKKKIVPRSIMESWEVSRFD